MPTPEPESFGQDALLNAFVKAAEVDDEALPVFLLVQGTVITGDLVGRQRWADVAAEVPKPADLRPMLGLPIAPSAPGADDGREGHLDVSGRYMHLLNVVVDAGGQSTYTLPFLRVRTDTVAAWVPSPNS